MDPHTTFTYGTLRIDRLMLGPIGTNCYIVTDTASEAMVIIDPADEVDKIAATVEGIGVTPDAILVTHSHWDHVLALDDAATRWDIPAAISEIEAPALADINQFVPDALQPVKDHTVAVQLPGQGTHTVGNLTFTLMHLPGHSPGSLAFVLQRDADTIVFGGDVLFYDSIGRTDLPFGDTQTLLTSLVRLVEGVPDESIVFPGHGQETTILRERTHNQFVMHALTQSAGIS